jgi:hypothetical protein
MPDILILMTSCSTGTVSFTNRIAGVYGERIRVSEPLEDLRVFCNICVIEHPNITTLVDSETLSLDTPGLFVKLGTEPLYASEIEGRVGILCRVLGFNSTSGAAERRIFCSAPYLSSSLRTCLKAHEIRYRYFQVRNGLIA